MERQRGTTIILVIALIIAVISLGVAFAAFSTTLTINGSATVQSSQWKVFFTTASDGSEPSSATSLPAASITKTGTAASTSASLTSTVFTWAATFKSPGDTIKYKFYVRNTGNYTAKVKTVTLGNISCSTDPKNACNKLSYGLYTDSAGNTPVAANQTIAAGSYAEYYLIATLDSSYGGTDGSGLVGSNVTTSTITATVEYEQSGSSN